MDLTALQKLSYGVYVITSKDKDKFSGCTVTTAMQLTSNEPIYMMVAINKENYTYEILRKSKKANISVLDKNATLELIGHFGFRTGKQYDKMQKVDYELANNGIPTLVQNTVCYFETTAINEINVGTHSIFVLKLDDCKKLNDNEPLTYDYYHKVIKGKTPPKASTFINI